MKKLNLGEVQKYVQKNIVQFHQNKLKALRDRDLVKLLKTKNPYLFKAKNLNLPQDFVSNLLEASLSSAEEEIFGGFLEELALFIVTKTAEGWKSTNKGIDLEFRNNGVHYLVSVKSGPNWGNNSQQTDQKNDFERAVRVARQSKQAFHIQPVLGICYGKTKTNALVRGAMKVVGQNFWYLLSENEELYTEIIEPLGVEAARNNNEFDEVKQRIIGAFTDQFSKQFATNGLVNWKRIVEFTCGNIDIEMRNGKLTILDVPHKQKKKE